MVHVIQVGGEIMKKSTIIIVLGIFIVVTALLGTNTNKMYQKQKNFETTTEILEQLSTKTLIAFDENGGISETNDLKECLSERKRLTYSCFNFAKIEVKKIEELDENQKESILKEYDTFRREFSKRRPITKEEPLRVDVKAYNTYMEQGKLRYGEPQELVIDLVLVDEGEGLVIDYIVEKHSEKFSEEGNKDA